MGAAVAVVAAGCYYYDDCDGDDDGLAPGSCVVVDVVDGLLLLRLLTNSFYNRFFQLEFLLFSWSTVSGALALSPHGHRTMEFIATVSHCTDKNLSRNIQKELPELRYTKILTNVIIGCENSSASSNKTRRIFTNTNHHPATYYTSSATATISPTINEMNSPSPEIAEERE